MEDAKADHHHIPVRVAGGALNHHMLGIGREALGDAQEPDFQLDHGVDFVNTDDLEGLAATLQAR